MKIIGILATLLIATVEIQSTPIQDPQNVTLIPYQGYFKGLVYMLHESSVKGLDHYDEYLRGIKDLENRQFFINLVTEVILLNPQKYSQDFSSTVDLIEQVYDDPFFWKRVDHRLKYLQKKE